MELTIFDLQGKAVGKLRKDNRTCELNFISSQGMLRISITVSQTK